MRQQFRHVGARSDSSALRGTQLGRTGARIGGDFRFVSDNRFLREQREGRFAALRFRDFRFLVLGSFLAVIAEQMLGVAVGWELYERTRNPLALGLVGLVEIVPVLLLALPAGHVGPRDRARDAGSDLYLRPAAGDRPWRDPPPAGQAEPIAGTGGHRGVDDRGLVHALLG